MWWCQIWNGHLAGTDSAELDVPLDHSDPDGKTITLYVVRHSARDEGGRIGSIGEPGWPRVRWIMLRPLHPRLRRCIARPV